MKLLTKAALKRFAEVKRQGLENLNEDPTIIVKFFDPCGSWNWYATEFEPETGLFFGMVHGFEKELGYFSLAELEAYKGSFGLGIERDMYFSEMLLSQIS